jgi:putative endonuclease
MNNKNNINIGKIGEDIAYKYLVNNRWRILERNYRRKSDEIDIIGISIDKILTFFEVKALVKQGLSTLDVLTPEDNLTVAKLGKISRTCNFFAGRHPEFVDPNRGWRIDLLAIELDLHKKMGRVRHYENIG